MTKDTDTAANSGADQTQQDDTKTDAIDTAAVKTAAVSDDVAPADKTVDKALKVANDTKPADDWRLKFAGEDAKELKRLGRFSTEADMYKAYRELEKKKSSGELRQALGKDATAEDLTQWRKENGIPETADKYDLSFDDGLVIGENDKPMVDKFVANMHGENATPAQVKAAIASYYGIVAEQQQARAEADVAFKDDSLSVLREEYQGDFTKNLNIFAAYIETAPPEVAEKLNNARMGDGNPLMNDSEVIKWMTAQAFEINPVATVMPGSVSNPGAAIGEEITSIEKLIGDKTSAYWRGTGSEKMQGRYLELLSAQEKIAARS